MNKISIFPNTTLRISKFNKRRAVSDVVAVLILIVIAIIGAVAVGLILSTTSHSVSSQAANNGNGQSATTELLLGGSTTLYPADQAAIPAFQTTYPGIKVVDAQGGSDAGMQGILSGALDIGAASSIVAVNNLYNAISTNNIVGVTPNPVLVGGSGVVFGTTSVCTNVASPGLTCTTPTSTTIGPNPWFDGTSGTPNTCLEMTRDALAYIYAQGVVYVVPGACTGNLLDKSGLSTTATISPPSATNLAVSSTSGMAATDTIKIFYNAFASVTTTITTVVDAHDLTVPALTATFNTGSTVTDTTTSTTTQLTSPAGPAGPTTNAGPFVAISRSDFGGTEDTACGYLKSVSGFGLQGLLSYTSGSGICGGSKNIGSGNFGVLSATQGCSPSSVGVTAQGCIGFFDFGFGEGKSPQAAATCSGAAGGKPCNVAFVEVTTNSGLNGETTPAANSPDLLLESSSPATTVVNGATVKEATVQSSYALSGDAVSNVDTFIKSALKTAATQNPQTLQYSQASSAQVFFPDPPASGAANPLDRTFYFVTNGTPTAAEQDWISFMSNYNAEPYWTGAGYYSQYDFTSA